MEEKEIQQHVQVPSNVNMEPDEKVLYAYIKQRMDSKTYEAFPSLDWIRRKTGFNRNHILDLVQSLEAKGFITVTKRKGTSNLYKFNPWVKFEPFSTEFLDDPQTSNEEKKFLICTQEHMFINPETHCGKISYSDNKLSQITGLNRKFIKKVNTSLKEKDFMICLPLKAKDEETGFCKTEKVYYLDEFNQAVAYTLQRHEEQIQENAQAISQTQEDMKILQNTVRELQKQLEKYKKKSNAIILD